MAGTCSSDKMSSDEERTSTPVLPKDSDRGSSVSSGLQDEYEELLRYAVVTPKWDSGGVRQSLSSTKPAACDKDLDAVEAGTSSGQRRNKRTQTPGTPSVPEKSDSAKKGQSLAVGTSSGQKRHKRQLTPGTTSVPEKPDSAQKGKTPEGQEVPQKITPSSASNTVFQLEGLVYSEKTPSRAAVRRTPEMFQSVCQLSIPAENLDKVENILNTANDQLKANILSEIRQWRLSVIEQHKEELKEEKEKHEAQIAQMACQTQSLNQLICTYEDSVRRKDEVISNLIQGLKNLKDKIELMRSFTQWRLQHSEAKAEDYACILADRHYNYCLMRKACTAWKSVVQTEWKTRVEKACQARAEEVCIQLSRDYERNLNASREELECARAEVRRLLAEKDKCTDSMKKAFMRGVCALNLEAMSMFQNGSRIVEHADLIPGRDDLDSCPSTSAPQPSVCPVPASLDPSIPFDSDRMITIHFGTANVSQTRAGGTSTLAGPTTVTTSLQSGFQSTQKLPVTKCASSAQHKSGKTIVARFTGLSDPATRAAKCGSSQGVSPPMTTICVERHHPVTQQTIGQATAAKYPRSSQPHPVSGGKVPALRSKSPAVNCGIQSIKVVD
ncbi:centrosomal protein POC5 isoform X3 [Amblyraja radiata]|uniref:centrosomal protein POC5 isoform X3 n=1 Tax=Amblyraja radiata TaxID=386614 RepID=UPI0014038E2E|nr:centrosomal protein POC5 isoform X3 [Amblyraja radiata]